MAKLTLNPAPTFKAKVAIPVAGGTPVDVEFTFKHRTRKQLADQMAELQKAQDSTDDVTVIMSAVEGWELDDDFNAANVERLLQNYHGAGPEIMRTYGLQLMGARLGN